MRQHPEAGTIVQALPVNKLVELRDFLKSDMPADAPSAGSGAMVFRDNCGACHGADRGGPTLSDLRALPEAKREERVLKHPVAGRIPQRLAAHELLNLTEFLASD